MISVIQYKLNYRSGELDYFREASGCFVLYLLKVKELFSTYYFGFTRITQAMATQENNEVSTKFRHALQGYPSSRSRNNRAGIF